MALNSLVDSLCHNQKKYGTERVNVTRVAYEERTSAIILSLYTQMKSSEHFLITWSNFDVTRHFTVAWLYVAYQLNALRLRSKLPLWSFYIVHFSNICLQCLARAEMKKSTRLPLNRRRTTRECVYLVALIWCSCFCDLDLDPMTLIYDLDILKMYPHTKNKVCKRLSKVTASTGQTDTDTHRDTDSRDRTHYRVHG